MGGRQEWGWAKLSMKVGSDCFLPCFAYTVLARRTYAAIDFCIYIHSYSSVLKNGFFFFFFRLMLVRCRWRWGEGRTRRGTLAPRLR